MHVPSPPKHPVDADASSPTLLQKRQKRHMAAINDFQDACRAIAIKCDDEIEARCHALRMSLTLSHEDSEHKLKALEEREKLVDGGLVGDELQELTLGILQEKNPNKRQMLRIEHRKRELRETLAELRRLAQHRMDDIDDTMACIARFEATRKTALEARFKACGVWREGICCYVLLILVLALVANPPQRISCFWVQELLRTLSEIASKTQQENAVLAEKAAVNMNITLLENDCNTRDFCLRVKKQELAQQKVSPPPPRPFLYHE